MNIATRIIIIGCVTIFTGCSDRQRNEQFLTDIGSLKLINSPGLEFHKTGGGEVRGTGARFASLEIVGEIIATNNSALPSHVADEIADSIKAEVGKFGGKTIGGSTGGGIHYTAAAATSYGITNVDLQQATLHYELNGAEGRVGAFVIERDYPSVEANKKVVGQLIVTLDESR